MVGRGVFVGTGAMVGRGVFVGAGVAVGLGVFVGVGAAVGLGVFMGVGAAVGLGVSVGSGGIAVVPPDGAGVAVGALSLVQAMAASAMATMATKLRSPMALVRMCRSF